MKLFIKLNQPDSLGSNIKRIAYVVAEDIKRLVESETNGKITTTVTLDDNATIISTDRAETIIERVNGKTETKPTEPKQNGQKQQKII